MAYTSFHNYPAWLNWGAGRWAQRVPHALLNLIRTLCSASNLPLAALPHHPSKPGVALALHSLSHTHAHKVQELLHLSIFCFCCGPCNHFMEITHALISSSAHLTFSPLCFRGSYNLTSKSL
ncbi:hypothetical protein MHYP_G00037260 [Metynnis hypsauchen]